jgi:dolichol-phosphate mannosyltransferase
MIDRKVIDIVSQCTEKNTHLPGLLMWTGFEYELIYYKRVRREHGKSRWNLSRKIKYFADAFTAFSYIPIRMGTLLGLFMSLLGFLYAGVVILLSLFGGIKIEGWSSLMIVVLILGGSQMIMLGILGEYLWRNFDQTRHRPLYLIDQVVKYENTSPNQNRLNSNHDKVPGNLDGTRI